MLNRGLGSHDELAASGVIGVLDAAPAANYPAGGKIRPLNITHQVFSFSLGMLQEINDGLNYLA